VVSVAVRVPDDVRLILGPLGPQRAARPRHGPDPQYDAPLPEAPWYVPERWRDAWAACVSSPGRRGVSELVWRLSVQGGRPDGWDYDEAMRVVAAEGGDDACQFNTSGSGACGPFQILPCSGLSLEANVASAFAKFRDGGGSFERHWYRFWR